jgi:hypothetical protein
VFSAADPFTGIDLDNCRDPETGELDRWAARFLQDLDGYAEVSPSGRGVKCFLRAASPFKTGRKKSYQGGVVEVYDHGRFFTVTGHRLERAPAEVRPAQEALGRLCAEVFGAETDAVRPGPKAGARKGSRGRAAGPGLPDEEVLLRAEGDAKFRRLWAGDTSGHGGDHSRADLALCSKLAYYSEWNAAQVDRLFRQSGLYRPEKWGEREDYRRGVIKKAMEEWVPAGREAAAPPPEDAGKIGTTSLDEYRAAMARAHAGCVGSAGVFLDRSPTGAGKSHADGAMLASLGRAEKLVRSITTLPTHLNCREVRDTMTRQGVDDVGIFPELSAATCKRIKTAERVITAGLSFPAVLCPNCEHRAGCPYREQLASARRARHTIATHKRAELSPAEVAEGRDVILIHEIPHDILRPLAQIKGGVKVAVKVMRRARELSGDGRFYRLMYLMAKRIRRALAAGSLETEQIPLPERSAPTPKACDLLLWRAISEVEPLRGPKVEGDVIQVLKAAAAGRLEALYLRVESYFRRGLKETPIRTIIGVKKGELPPSATVILSDATTSAAEAEALAGRAVTDITPPGRLHQFHPVWQVPVDVQKQTAPRSVLAVLRGVLLRHRSYGRVGVITHQKHVPVVRGQDAAARLEPDLQARVVKVEYFRSGHSAATNEWMQECDLLVVLGTPRVPEVAVRDRLLQLGKQEAAMMARDKAGWGVAWWKWQEQDGAEEQAARGRGYGHPDWAGAQRQLVVGELVQAIGRGRGILENGIPVVVAATEQLPPGAAQPCRFRPVTEAAMEVYQVLFELAPPPVCLNASTAQIAAQLGATKGKAVDNKWVRELLADMASWGLIYRERNRKGWSIDC